MQPLPSHSFLRPALLLAALTLCGCAAFAQTAAGPGTKNGGQKAGTPASTAPAGGKRGAQGGESKSAASDGSAANKASGKPGGVSAIAPAVPPPNRAGRPRIGVALGGGAALAMSEIGALQWFEEHHIPVDVIAGTSMGCMISALYSTGKSTDQLKSVMTDTVFTSVFSFSNSYQSRSFRRREDSRELPNGVTIGLRHGISFRNSVLIDQGLDAFLDRQFLRYDDQTDFNNLPIPLRCVSTDLNDAVPVTFARGSIPDAVRASVSIPGVYKPFEMNGHEYVDGGVLENLPTQTVRDMKADVVIAVSLPLEPVSQGELDSILGVLTRSASTGIEAEERRERTLANVVVMPDIKGFGPNDYLKAPDLAQRGYAAAESQKAALLPYALDDAHWAAYLAFRKGRLRAPAGPVLRVRVQAPDPAVTKSVQQLFTPLVNEPVDTRRIEALLDQVRADGRYDADYTVGYETTQQFQAQTAQTAPTPRDAADVPVVTNPAQTPGATPPAEPQKPGAPLPNPNDPPRSTSAPKATTPQPSLAQENEPLPQELTPEALADIPARPILLVTIADKKTGPPFLVVGANIEAQTTAVTRATIEGILVDQDLGGYGSELRTGFKLGYLTGLTSEYFRPFNFLSDNRHALYYQPHLEALRQPFSIYSNQVRLADRQLDRSGGGLDLGWTNRRNADLRLGIADEYIDWVTLVGTDNTPTIQGNSQRARLQYTFDDQDRALVPQFGFHITTEAAFQFDSVASPNAPRLFAQGSYSRSTRTEAGLAGKNTLVFAAEGGSYFHRNVAQPFRFTLGGPLRLSASAIDEYRGTDYFLVEPAILRRVAKLPSPLGQNIYLGGGFEAGRIFAPNTPTITRQDVYFGIVAETPLGIITFAPAIGDDGHRKFVFTLGKLF
jgi:NTE family protein